MSASRSDTVEDLAHDCRLNVRPQFRDDRIDKNVINALRRSGLTGDQALDAFSEMRRSGIIFGELHLNGNDLSC